MQLTYVVILAGAINRKLNMSNFRFTRFSVIGRAKRVIRRSSLDWRVFP